MTRREKATDFSRLLHGFEGKWVAILDGEVVDAAETPYELVARLRSGGIKDASMIRAPALEEPEMVAFG